MPRKVFHFQPITSDVAVRMIGVKSDVERSDADEFDGTPVAEGAPRVAGMPRVFGNPLHGRKKLAKLHVFARAQRSHRRFIQRVADSAASMPPLRTASRASP